MNFEHLDSLLDKIKVYSQSMPWAQAANLCFVDMIRGWTNADIFAKYAPIHHTPEIEKAYDQNVKYYHAFLSCIIEETRFQTFQTLASLNPKSQRNCEVLSDARITKYEERTNELNEGEFIMIKFTTELTSLSEDSLKPCQFVAVLTQKERQFYKKKNANDNRGLLIGVTSKRKDDENTLTISFTDIEKARKLIHLGRDEPIYAFPLSSFIAQMRAFASCASKPRLGWLDALIHGSSFRPKEPSNTNDPIFSKLNHKQREAAETFYYMDKGILLVQGPPGTGKSTLIISTVRKLVCERKARVTLCVHHNEGVHLLAKKYIELENKTNVFILGAEESRPVDEDLRDIFIPTHKEGITKAQKDGVKEILRKASVVFCTVTTMGSGLLEQRDSVDALIIDEAGRVCEAEALIALASLPTKCLLVGDTKQLPALVLSTDCKERNYDRSMMTRMIEDLKQPHSFLTHQYRMDPEISSWVRGNIYRNELQDSEYVQKRENTAVEISPEAWMAPYSFVNVDGYEKAENAGLWNEHEVMVILHIIRALWKLGSYKDGEYDIAILCYYKLQVERVNGMLQRNGYPRLAQTVDSSQGKEYHTTLLAFTRCNGKGNIGFLSDSRRLNVSLTRSKYSLIMIGNYETLTRGSKSMKDLLDDAKSRNQFFKFAKNAGITRPNTHKVKQLTTKPLHPTVIPSSKSSAPEHMVFVEYMPQKPNRMERQSKSVGKSSSHEKPLTTGQVNQTPKESDQLKYQVKPLVTYLDVKITLKEPKQERAGPSVEETTLKTLTVLSIPKPQPTPPPEPSKSSGSQKTKKKASKQNSKKVLPTKKVDAVGSSPQATLLAKEFEKLSLGDSKKNQPPNPQNLSKRALKAAKKSGLIPPNINVLPDHPKGTQPSQSNTQANSKKKL